MFVDIFKTRKKYAVLYADPPWDYSYLGKNFDKQFTKNKSGWSQGVMSANDHYNTMTNADIAGLPIDKITAEDCLVFMWITNPMLDIGLEVIKAWGFEFKTVAKKKGGRIPKPRGARNIRQFLQEKRGAHSKKPDAVLDKIKLMFPTQKKIELFSRLPVKGWDAWGNDERIMK